MTPEVPSIFIQIETFPKFPIFVFHDQSTGGYDDHDDNGDLYRSSRCMMDSTWGCSQEELKSVGINVKGLMIVRYNLGCPRLERRVSTFMQPTQPTQKNSTSIMILQPLSCQPNTPSSRPEIGMLYFFWLNQPQCQLDIK